MLKMKASHIHNNNKIIKEKVWPPGSADKICLRWSLMTGIYSIGPTRLRLITWPCNLDLWPWRSWRLWLMRVVDLHAYTKFEKVRCMPCRSEDIFASDSVFFSDVVRLINCYIIIIKVGNRPSKFGHARPLGSRIIPYVYATDGRTDGRTDKSNAYYPFRTGGGVVISIF